MEIVPSAAAIPFKHWRAFAIKVSAKLYHTTPAFTSPSANTGVANMDVATAAAARTLITFFFIFSSSILKKPLFWKAFSFICFPLVDDTSIARPPLRKNSRYLQFFQKMLRICCAVTKKVALFCYPQNSATFSLTTFSSENNPLFPFSLEIPVANCYYIITKFVFFSDLLVIF